MTKVGNIAGDQLKSYIERIERLDEEKAGLASDIRDVFAEAKSNGFCVPTMREIIKLRKKDATERDEAEHMLDLYLAALDMRPALEDAA